MSSDLHSLERSEKAEDEGPRCPEALLISAYLEQGVFTPEIHHVGPDDIWAWSRLWRYCIEYQQKAGVAPPLSLIRRTFPDFDLTRDISAEWASSLVRDASASRHLRKQIAESLTALAAEDTDSAYGALAALQRPHGHRKMALNVLDHATVEESDELNKIRVPWISLAKATGGIGPAELWYFAARPGEGKSWSALQFAKVAAQNDQKVLIHSLEMKAKKMAKRAHMLLAGPNPRLLGMLRSRDIKVQQQALNEIDDMTPGSISVIDPSHGRINTCAAVAESCTDYDLVIVDHVGLMLSPDGHRGVEDWRYAAAISNIMRETTLESGTSILGTVQINRDGENKSPYPPALSKMSGTDALGQDADVAVTMKKICRTVQVFSAEKVREGPNLYWYARFDVARNRFEEITKEEAEEIRDSETDAAADQLVS